ncbi:VanZ family protein [Cerasicoccus frondis]|uniref:VanZ family protein n=1 Tax=Cerasicoccus frondis TaxID=490090 RepID=UPI002852AA1A|nr:VanZ family protein [Cerasicoccus frondis]
METSRHLRLDATTLLSVIGTFIMSTNAASQRRINLWKSRIRWWQPVGLMATITIVSGGNPAPLPITFFSYDKIIHLLVFGLLATSIYRLIKPSWPQGLAAVLAIGVTSVFGLLDELHQSQTPGRFMDLADWTADIFGAVLAVYVYRGWAGYRRFLEFAILPRKAKLKP